MKVRGRVRSFACTAIGTSTGFHTLDWPNGSTEMLSGTASNPIAERCHHPAWTHLAGGSIFGGQTESEDEPRGLGTRQRQACLITWR